MKWICTAGTYWDSLKCNWKNIDEMLTDDRHKVYYGAGEGLHEYRVGILVKTW